MQSRIYSIFSTYPQCFSLRKLVVLLWVLFSAGISAQVIHDENNSMYIAEGTTVSVVQSPSVPSPHKPVAVKKIKKPKTAHLAAKTAKHKDTSPGKYAAADRIIISSSEDTQHFALGKTSAGCAVMSVTSGSGKSKADIQEKTCIPLFFSCSTYQHNSIYKESHRRFEVPQAYSCRPPPNCIISILA